MSAARRVRIVLYAVNGTGVGHLTRLIAAARWIRRYAAHAGVRAELWFLTTSEADVLLFHERFVSFKLPSRTALSEGDVDRATYLALAKQWVWHTLGLLSPDLLVVDTFPRGAFGELLSALDLVQRRAFVFRPVKDEVMQRADFQAMLPMYDAIIVPEREGEAEVLVPDAARDALVFTGPVMARERVELLSRADARDRLGIADHARAVLVSAGGGGDATAEATLARAVAVLRRDPRAHLVVAAGPLYRGPILGGERVTFHTSPALSELMPAFDVAVSGAGYNTFSELMHAGVPAVFLPQDKRADDQHARAAKAERAGAGVVLPDGFTDDELAAATARLADDPDASARARALVPRNHARELAAELLRLVLPAHEVDEAEAVVDDALLASARALATTDTTLIALARSLEHGARRRERDAELPALVLRAGLDAGATAETTLEVVDALLRVTTASRQTSAARKSASERARLAREALTALGALGDWTSAAALTRAYVREHGATGFAAFVDDLHARGESARSALVRGIA